MENGMEHSHNQDQVDQQESAARFAATPSKLFIGGLCALLLAGCTDITNTPGASGSNDDGYGYESVDEDPLEPLNRPLFAFNTYLDEFIVRPVASTYSYIVPDEGRKAVTNVLDNLNAPVVFVNSVLQGDVENSFATFWSFLLNSTIGIAGIYDFAGNEGGIETRSADFGQTLASYGVSSGPYLVLPIFGPSTLRDGAGRGVDVFFSPITYLDEDVWSIAQGVTRAIDFRANNMKLIDDLNNNSIDPYSAYRSVYLQRRAAQMRNWGSAQ